MTSNEKQEGSAGRPPKSSPTGKKTLPVFARRLREARELRGLSQEDLASLAVLQQPAVSFYERGARRPSHGNLRKLADALEVTTDYLIGRTSTPGAAPGIDDETLQAYARLTHFDRVIARGLILQLAQRATASTQGIKRSKEKKRASPTGLGIEQA
jgi:transcriptional regulator with XRE-family HTH domain